MPEFYPGLEKIKVRMKEENILAIDLAITYGIKPSDMSDILNGKDTSPRAAKVIVKIVRDLTIR
ncbi:XRE family transcriptional regulator [Lactococcus petauri]|jgi:predicted transcriptional regulator|uniref:XRE family transcriptional regulator n=1 Tax=Lactococcus petauri TaxID=1940789 RepID=UPI0018AB57DD|nr:XRE family transcriptional regulator [Lactococcus petauri]MDC0808964.1 XRE family transcriptional regulator [Lactococcus petauri]MDC0812819.1 XRE family transcriptional regulator [Lactococcus petauri]